MPFAERKDELSTTIAFSASNVSPLTNGVPRDQELTKLLVMLEGQMALSSVTASPTLHAEAPASFIRRFELRGTKVGGAGAVTLINARGEELHALTRFYQGAIPLGPGIADFPGGPGNVAFPSPLSPIGAAQRFDFRTAYILPIAYPFAGAIDEAATILPTSLFSQLDLFISWAAGSNAMALGGTATFTFNSFGATSTTGNPVARITRFMPLALSGGFKDVIGKYHVLYNSQQKNLSAVGTSFTDTRIADLNVGNRLRAIHLRQYIEDSNVTGLIGQTAALGTGARVTDNTGRFSAGAVGDNSNAGVYRWRLKVNGAEKWRFFNTDLREWNRYTYGEYSTLHPQGYATLEFAPRRFPVAEAFNLIGYGPTGSRFELFGDATGLDASNHRIDILQVEQVPVAV